MNQNNSNHVITVKDKDFLKQLPKKPGVYQYFNDAGTLLYVGKAIDLKARVSSYFKSTVYGKTKALVADIVSLQFIITRNETEALLLEANLIKKHRPKYNILLRDDKTYPYIYLSDDEYPSLCVFRGKKQAKKKGKLFGPFPNAYWVKETLEMLVSIFKLRTCRQSYFNNRSRPCLEYQINRCSAPCVKRIDKESYDESIRQATLLLNGQKADLMDELEKSMLKASNEYAFEKAAFYRDKIKLLSQLGQKQFVSVAKGLVDIIKIIYEQGLLMAAIVQVKEGDVHHIETIRLNVSGEKEINDAPQNYIDELLQEASQTIVKERYLLVDSIAPPKLLIPELNEVAAIEDAFKAKNQKIKVRNSARGNEKTWLDLAYKNAHEAIESFGRSKSQVQHRLNALKEALHLDKPLKRIECFDISHSQGTDTVASCVVYNSEGADKKSYRLFNISGITPGDDYAAMEQALTRRFKYKPLPEVLLIDGGKGQVGIANQVLQKLNLFDDVLILGVAKGPSRKSGLETLILSQTDTVLSLDEHSPARHLIQFVRDEAHRFAITNHRKKRQKTSHQSLLNDIEGIGPKRRRQLLQRFGGIKAISRASIEDILSLPGFSESLAKAIKEHLSDD